MKERYSSLIVSIFTSLSKHGEKKRVRKKNKRKYEQSMRKDCDGYEP